MILFVLIALKHKIPDIEIYNLRQYTFNPLNAELNPICKSQLAKLFCRVFKFCTCFLKNLNILRTKQDKFVKQKVFHGEGNRH
jgi:hypothetical protein